MFILTLFFLTVGDVAESLAAWFGLIVGLIASVVRWYYADPVKASAYIVGALAVLREFLLRLEGYLVIWHPPQHDSRFWLFWANLMATIDRASLSSPRKPDAIRKLYAWDKQRKQVKAMRQDIADAAIGAPRDGNQVGEGERVGQ